MIHTWKHLDRIEQLNEIAENSTQKTTVIFKHSTTCGISQHAMHKLVSNWDLEDDQLDFYYLDLLRYRPVSNEVANHFGVIHQSPQILVIKDGKSVYDISHNAISVATLKEHL